jgi:hypothetical protein
MHEVLEQYFDAEGGWITMRARTRASHRRTSQATAALVNIAAIATGATVPERTRAKLLA